MPFFVKSLSIPELKKSNVLLTGTNQQGKTRLAMAITETLQNQGLNENWRIIVFDVVGHWKSLSSVPYYVQIKQLRRVKILEHSIIFDISYLLPSEQKQFVESALLDLWTSSLDKPRDNWTLCIFEESQLYTRSVRGVSSQQIQRIFSVGANMKIRSLAITPSLTGIDPEFIRLCNQRFHFRLGNEQNIKRKFKSYYGKDWLTVALDLSVGYFINYLNGNLAVKHVNLFESENTPKELHCKKPEPETQPEPVKKKGFWGKLFTPNPNQKPVTIDLTEQRRQQEQNDIEEEEDFILILEDL